MRAHAAATLLALALLSGGCLASKEQASCAGLSFQRAGAAGASTPRVNVSDADEAQHPALKWLGDEVARGAASANESGRALAEDFNQFATSRGVDPYGVPTPVFVVRGQPLLVRATSACTA